MTEKNELTVFHELYKYDPKKKEWKHMGYRCIGCNQVFLRFSTVPRHSESCSYLHTIKDKRKRKKGAGRDPDEDVTILTVSGEVWQPLDFNQK
jgi:hypothetical protein